MMRDFLLTDQVGTLRAVADSTGTIVKRIDYDSFGNIIADSNPGFTVPFGFAGGLHDRDTGLVRFGYRDYSPELGRFVAKDPIDFAGGDTNLYAYVLNDPVNGSDPSGLAGPQRIPPELIPPSLPPSPDLPDTPLPGARCADPPGCTPTFHRDEYWRCVGSLVLDKNFSAYATGVVGTGVAIAAVTPPGLILGTGLFVGTMALTVHDAAQCRAAAIHCD